MMNIKDLARDRDFLGLPVGEQRKVVMAIDQDFAGLPIGEQDKVLTAISGKKLSASVPSPVASPPKTASLLDRLVEATRGISPGLEASAEPIEQGALPSGVDAGQALLRGITSGMMSVPELGAKLLEPYFPGSLEKYEGARRGMAEEKAEAAKKYGLGQNVLLNMIEGGGSLGAQLPVDIMAGGITKEVLMAPKVAASLSPFVQEIIKAVPGFAFGMGGRGALTEAANREYDPITRALRTVAGGMEGVTTGTLFGKSMEVGQGLTPAARLLAQLGVQTPLGAGLSVLEAGKEGRLPTAEELATGAGMGAAFGLFGALKGKPKYDAEALNDFKQERDLFRSELSDRVREFAGDRLSDAEADGFAKAFEAAELRKAGIENPTVEDYRRGRENLDAISERMRQGFNRERGANLLEPPGGLKAEGTLSNPLKAEAVLRGNKPLRLEADEKAMGVNAALEKMLAEVRGEQAALPPGQGFEMQGAAYDPVDKFLRELLAKQGERAQLPAPERTGEGFTFKEPGTKTLLKKGEPQWTEGRLPEEGELEVDYKPRLTRTGAPFKTERSAWNAISKLGIGDNFTVVPVAGGFGLKRVGAQASVKPPTIIDPDTETRSIVIGDMISLLQSGEAGLKVDHSEGLADVTGRFTSNPKWYGEFQKEFADKMKMSASKDEIIRTLRKEMDGKPMTEKQRIISDLLEKHIRNQENTNYYRRIWEELDKASRAKPPEPENIAAGDLSAPGSKIVMDGEVYTSKGFDAEGNVVLKDGKTIRVDPFETIKGDVIKYGENVAATRTASTVKEAIEAISAGAEEVTVPRLRPDLEQYGGTADVTFIYGNDKKGLYHIGSKRGPEVVREVIATVEKGNINKYVPGNKTVRLSRNGYEAILSLDEHGRKKTWLLTGWAKQKPDAPGEVGTQSGATQIRPTFSRSDLVAGFGNNLPPSSANVKGKGKEPGPTLYSGLDPVAAAKAFRDVAHDIKQALPRLEALGRSVFDSGIKTAKEWAATMKSFLGELWAKFRGYVRDIWYRLKETNRNPRNLSEERGSFSLEKKGEGGKESAMTSRKETGGTKAEIEAEIKDILDTARKNGTLGKAPNGQKSNLNDRQWAMVRTRRFKEWFGDWEAAAYIQNTKEFIDKVTSGKRPENIIVGFVSGKAAGRIKQLTGVNVKNAPFELVANDVFHALKDHGDAQREARRTPPQEALTAKDLEVLPFVLSEPSKIDMGTIQDGRKSVVFQKKINGTLFAAEIVPSAGGSMLFKTAWKRPSEKADALLTPDHTPEAVPSPSHSYGVTIQAILEKVKNSSKVVDENGEPLVVYHGTGGDFSTFDSTKTNLSPRGNSGSLGFFFTIDRREASHYAMGYPDGGAIMPVYLNIRNPKIIERYTDDWNKILNSRADAKKVQQQLSSAGYDGAITPLGEYVAFSPTQIKSATGNIGTFDKTDSNILYSGVDITKAPEVLRHIWDTIKDYRSVLPSGDSTLLQKIWQSPHWYAKKHPEFKPIYDRQLKREQDRAKLLDARLKGWESARNLSRKDIKRLAKVIWITEGKKIKSVTEPRFVWKENEWGVEGVKGQPLRVVKGLNLKHYRQIEDYLKARGVNDNVARAYVDIRKNFDRSYAMIFNKMVSMKDVEAGTIEKYRQEIGNISNYFPHQWYGNYHFHGLDKNGDVAVRIQYNDAAPFGYSTRYRAKLAQAKKDYPEVETWTAPKKSRQMPEEVYEYPIPVEAMEQIINAAAERVRTDNPQAADIFRKAMPEAVSDVMKSRGFGSHMIRRKGVKGYEKEDILRVLHDFDASFSGWITKMEAAHDFSQLLRDIPAKDKPQLYSYASRYVKDVLANADQIDRVVDTARAGFFLYYLGGVLKSGTVNLTQPIINGIPRLSVDTGMRALVWVKAAADDLVACLTKDRNLKPDEARLLDELYREGATQAQLANEIKGRISGLGGQFLNSLNNAAGFFMAVTERFNRGSLSLAAYRLARDGKISNPKTLEAYGLKQGQKADYETAKRYAEDVNNDANFVYGKGNLPEVFRGRTKLLRPAYSLATFSHQLLQLWGWMLRQGGPGMRAFALSIMATAFFGGLMSVPFIKPVFEAWRKEFGTDPQKEIRDWMPEAMKDMAIYGMPAALGVNIGGSLAIGDIDMSNPAKFLVGVPWSMWENADRAVEAYRSGQTGRAVEEASPAVIKNPLAAWRLYDQGQFSISGKPINFPGEAGPRKITALEAVGKAFGFQPVSSTKVGDVRKNMEDLEGFVKNKQTKWANRYVNAWNRDDLKEMTSIADEVAAWNDRWMKAGKPEFTIRLRDAIRNRVKPYQPPRKFRALGQSYTEEYQ